MLELACGDIIHPHRDILGSGGPRLAISSLVKYAALNIYVQK